MLGLQGEGAEYEERLRILKLSLIIVGTLFHSLKALLKKEFNCTIGCATIHMIK